MSKVYTSATDISPASLDLVIGNSNYQYPNFIGNNYASATLNTASGTNATTLFTGAPGWYITRLLVQVDPICTTSGGGMITVSFTDSVAGTIGQARFYAPASAGSPTTAVISPQVESGAGYIIMSKNSNSVVSVSLNNALTAGSVRVAVNFGLTSFINH